MKSLSQKIRHWFERKISEVSPGALKSTWLARPEIAPEKNWLPMPDFTRAFEILSPFKNLNLNGSNVRLLKKGTDVNGDLLLEDCPRLREIGPGVKVSGKLAIGGRAGRGKNRQCYICELPALSAGRLKLAHCPSLTHLPEGLEVVSLELSACDALQALPEDLNLKELRITGCRSLRALPSRMKVERLVLTNAAIEEIPDFFGAREVLISGCRRLRSLPPAWSGVEISLKHLPKIDVLPDMSASFQIRVSNLPCSKRSWRVWNVQPSGSVTVNIW